MAYSQLVAKQREFFLSGATHSINARKDRLKTLKKLIKENDEALCAAVERDLRRDPKSTYALEIANAIVEIDYMIDNLDEWMATERVGKTLTTMLDTPMLVKDPKGVVLLISPWNYPVSMILLPLIPAIAAGNTVIIKPSEVSANVSRTFDELVPKYFEPEFMAVVQGAVQETTDLLKERFDHIFYTGCPPVAKIIMAAAAKHLTPVTLELGGKCPVVVEDDVEVEVTARRIAWGKWLNCGQTCLAPDYILVSQKMKPALVAAFRKVLTEFYGPDPKDSKDYSRIISERHWDRLTGLLSKTKGVRMDESPSEPDRGDLFIPPTIVECDRDDVLMHDEIFGPILPIITVSGLNDAIDYIKRGEKPLAAYIFTRSEAKVKKFYTETSSGAITVNDVIMHITVDTLPFGGVGNSGMGRYRGKYGFDTFTHEKAVLKRGFFGESFNAVRYPPITAAKAKNMLRLTGTRYAMPRWVSTVLPTLPIVVISVILGMLVQRYKNLMP